MSAERFTLDTNVLVHFLDQRDPVRQASAAVIIEAALGCDCILANQALAEFYAVATRKLAMPPADAARRVRDWLDVFPSVPATRNAIAMALDEAEAGRFAFWDALLLAATGDAGCVVVLSEDMAEGQALGRIVVRRPFTREGELSTAARRLLGL